MTELKTKKNRRSVKAFIDSVEDERRRKDCREVMTMMRKVTGKQPKMWGDAIVGFGSYHYKYASGREGEFFITGLSPRKQNLTIYIMPGFSKYGSLMKKLGKHKTGKSCLYVKTLEDIDRGILAELVEKSVLHMRQQYECE